MPIEDIAYKNTRESGAACLDELFGWYVGDESCRYMCYVYIVKEAQAI